MPGIRSPLFFGIVAAVLLWIVSATLQTVRSPELGFLDSLTADDPILVFHRLGASLLVLVLGLVWEVAVRRKDEDLAAKERLELAFAATRDGAWDYDLVTGRMVYNQAWADMLGLDLETIRQDTSTWLGIVHPEDHQRVETLLRRHLEGQLPKYESEVRLRHADGHYVWVLDRGRIVQRNEDGLPIRMTGTHRDITARKEAEFALEIRNRIAEVFLTAREDQVYQEVLGIVAEALDSPAGLLLTSPSSGHVRVAAALEGHGPGLSQGELEQRLGRDILPDLVDNPDGSPDGLLTVPIANRDQILGIICLAGRDGEYAPADRELLQSLAAYIAPVIQSRLSSESKETQLRQAQKMEALGSLAGGISHDFNNILQAIMGFTTLAQEEAEPGSRIAQDLEHVLRAARRGKELVQRILLFSRTGEQKRRPVEIHRLVFDAVELLRPTMPSTIEITTELDPDAGLILADDSRISQALLNLATNAQHAMDTEGGTLEIRLSRRQGKPGESERAEIVLKDSGHGMEPKVLERLFDPFFTTKEVGKGTGLGLSVVHGIVQAHEGDIRVESELGVGTTVTMTFPLIEAEPEETDSSVEAEDSSPVRGAQILFIDDEVDITMLGKALLEKDGHQVEMMSDGPLALDRVVAEPGAFDLIVTDLTMPRLTGPRLADELVSRGIDVPVLLITGMDEETFADRERFPAICGVIPKPFDGPTLRKAVRQVLLASEADPVDPGSVPTEP